MTRRARIALISAGCVALLAIIAAGTGFVMVRSGWLRGKIEQRIVAEAEQATGGKVEIGDLRLDWKTLRAEVDNLTIHGTEPADAAPLLIIKRLTVGFKVVSFLQREFNVALVEAEAPHAHLIIQADGSTNIPRPKTPSSRTTPETILALKIGKFDLANGVVSVDRIGGQTTTTPWNARGENLAAHLNYSSAGPRYEGAVAIAPLELAWNGTGRSVTVAANVAIEANRLTVTSATLKSGQSQVDLSNIVLDGFNAPVITGRYRGQISLAEVLHRTGTVSANGDFRFISLRDYTITGAVDGSGIAYGKVRGVRVSGDLTATPGSVRVKGMRVRALGGEMLADGEVRNLEDFHLTGSVRSLDARVAAALATNTALPYDGVLSGSFDAAGKLNHIAGSATLQVSPAPNTLPVHGELVAKYDGRSTEFGLSRLELPGTRVEFSGVPGSRLDVRLESRDPRDLSPVVDLKTLPEYGMATFAGSVTGPLTDPGIAGHATIENAVYQGQQIGSIDGDFTADRNHATVNNAALVSGKLRLRISGSFGLSNWKPGASSTVNANVRIANADINMLLALGGQKGLPVSGILNTTAQVNGTAGDQHATADFTLAKGQVYGEPYDSITGHAQYLTSGSQLLTADVIADKKRLNVSVRSNGSGNLAFNFASNAMPIGQIALARKNEPDLRGAAQVKADGVLRIDRAKSQMDLLDLNADLTATGLSIGARSLGDSHLTAATKNGVMTARIDSNVAKSSVHGEGTMRLAGDYPIDARLTFSNLGLSSVVALVRGPAGNLNDLNLDGSAAGEVTLTGPATTPELLGAVLNINQFELHPLNLTGDAKKIADPGLRNNGPIRASLSKSAIHIESARFAAPETDLTLSGNIIPNSTAPLDLHVRGNMNLALAQTWSTDLTSSGELNLDAAVRGNFTNPDVTGRADLRSGEFHYADFSNGMTNANAVFLFNGPRVTIQSLSAETGGGKVDVTGFAALAGGLAAFRVEARTQGVRVRYPEGVSSVSDSDLTFAGTSARSEVSGNVTIRRVSINPKSDVSTILAAVAQPARAAQNNTGLLSNMNLDVQVATAPDVAFETSVAQSIEADANLRVRGTVTNPAVIGRVNITEGNLTFFGNKYTINQGSISFFNPAKIDPILNVDLETKARGVDVVLTVSGPLNKLNVGYRSDPPLQFSDIVALLTTGRTPTDPTLAIRDTGQSQSLQQIGASALISEAIANPVAGRLQRFFGVSKIKIDPQLTGITGSPEARLTIEQQVSPDLLFTYITDVSSTSTQLIRVEWNLNRRWSAILTREENGYVGVDFAYKKSFK